MWHVHHIINNALGNEYENGGRKEWKKVKYVVLLRKINVGKENRIDKKSLEETFKALAYDGVEVYINSGNVIFTSPKGKSAVMKEIGAALQVLFKAHIQFLVKTINEMKVIGRAIPEEWKNDEEQRTDVLFLFPEIDRPGLAGELPIRKEFVKMKYVKGALIMNVRRENVYKSKYSRIVGSESYKFMTIRNVNTARYLAGMDK